MSLNKNKVGIIWDETLLLTRYIEDCGFPAIMVTSHMLAAPFYRGRYGAVIIPSGFADLRYSRVLPALRACSQRMRDYVNRGGVLLVFGGGADRMDAYDWLPFCVNYHFGFLKKTVSVVQNDPLSSFIDDGKKEEPIDIDGYLAGNDGDVIALAGEKPVLLKFRWGLGYIVISTIHEYPSCTFIADFCTSAPGEILL